MPECGPLSVPGDGVSVQALTAVIYLGHSKDHHMTRTLSLTITGLLLTGLHAQPGTLDPTFGTAGIQELVPGTLHDVAHDVIALPDTSLLICGVAQHDGNNAVFLAHLLQNGTLDPGFGTDAGYSYFNLGEEAYGYSMALDLEGRICVAGLAYPTFAQSTVLLARADANGIPDASFGTGGIVSTPVGTGDAEAQGLLVQPDGKMVLGGSVINTSDFSRQILFLRFMPDGSLDDDFGTDGITMFQPAGASGSQLLDVALLDDGSLVGVGYADVNFVMETVLARVDADGLPYTGFGSNGAVLPGFNAVQDRAFGVLADGQQFLVTGDFMATMSNADAYLARFNDDGSLDEGFGTDGMSLVDLNPNEVGLGIAKDAAGHLVMCGTTGQFGFAAARDFLVARFTSAGLPDGSFGNNGSTVTSIDVDFDDANAVAIQPDGKIVAAGFTAGFSDFTDNDVAVVRYLGDVATAVDVQAGHPPVVLRDGDRTTIRCAERMDRVELFAANGRRVLSLDAVNAPSVAFSMADLAPGPYQARLWMDGRPTVVKVMR